MQVAQDNGRGCGECLVLQSLGSAPSAWPLGFAIPRNQV